MKDYYDFHFYYANLWPMTIDGLLETYRPQKNVDYESYTLFMSSVAHDYKRLGLEEPKRARYRKLMEE